MTIRRSKDRGAAKYGWLDTRYTFSFANYYDPDFMGFSHLRVINEDIIAPSNGFETHDHANMEIVTWVIEGELTHQDSLGSKGRLRADDAQVMSAGTGIEHSERNESADHSVHLLQIWLEPTKAHQTPRYAQKNFPLAERLGKKQLIATEDGRDGSLQIGQNATVSVIHLRSSDAIKLSAQKQQIWIQSISAEIVVNQQHLLPGDGVAVTKEDEIELQGTATEGDVLLFEIS